MDTRTTGARHFKALLKASVIALACVIAAVLVWALFRLMGTTLPFAQFFPAVLIASYVGGLLAGGLTIIFSALIVLWLIYWPVFPWPSFAVDLLFFVLTSSVVAWVAASLCKAQADLNLALSELQHRGKNTFAVVSAIVHQSLPHDKGLAATITGRIKAVSSTNDIIADSPEMTVSLATLIKEKVQPFSSSIELLGPEVLLSATTARAVSLIIHELATNAAKHGALTTPTGQVSVHWITDGSRLNLKWTEAGGPAVKRPEESGFGSNLLATICRSIGAACQVSFNSTGLQVALQFHVDPAGRPVQNANRRPMRLSAWRARTASWLS